MNIAAIYDKYDLWGKVRVGSYTTLTHSRKGCKPWDSTQSRLWLIVIDGVKYYWPMTQGILGALEAALKDYIKCEPCEGTGVVPSAPYTASGNIPDCDTVKCKKCNGTGERA